MWTRRSRSRPSDRAGVGERHRFGGRRQVRPPDQTTARLASVTHDYRVVSTAQRFHGRVFDVVTDEVQMPGGATAPRDYIKHVGAVGVVALDDENRVVLVRQYRHPVRAHLWELPAGLVDVAGE